MSLMTGPLACWILLQGFLTVSKLPDSHFGWPVELGKLVSFGWSKPLDGLWVWVQVIRLSLGAGGGCCCSWEC